jgi:hypothetical protein
MSHPSADSSVDYTGSVAPTLPSQHPTIQQLLQDSTTAEPSPPATATTVQLSLSNESSVTDREELVKPQSRHLWPCFSLYNKLRLGNNLRVALLEATSSAEEAATYTMIKKRHHDDPNPVLKSWLVGCGSTGWLKIIRIASGCCPNGLPTIPMWVARINWSNGWVRRFFPMWKMFERQYSNRKLSRLNGG